MKALCAAGLPCHTRLRYGIGFESIGPIGSENEVMYIYTNHSIQ